MVVLLVFNYELTPSVSNLREFKRKSRNHLISLYRFKSLMGTDAQKVRNWQAKGVFNQLNFNVRLGDIECKNCTCLPNSIPRKIAQCDVY